jgi:hypothetical protein
LEGKDGRRKGKKKRKTEGRRSVTAQGFKNLRENGLGIRVGFHPYLFGFGFWVIGYEFISTQAQSSFINKNNNNN